MFIDQDGIPTLVEVKRSTDTRIRREVVGQLLDYAANGLVYWPIEHIRSGFEATCAEKSIDPDLTITKLLGPDKDTELFWDQVATNLKIGKVRLAFVADEIPPELQRNVEFLNGQMNPAQVVAIEIKQYLYGNVRALSPRVTGMTAEAQLGKSSTNSGKRWTEEQIFKRLHENAPEIIGVVEKLSLSGAKQDAGYHAQKGKGSLGKLGVNVQITT